MAGTLHHSSTDIYVSSDSSRKIKRYSPNDPPENVIPDKKSKTISLTQRVIKPRPIKKSIYEHIYEELQELNPNEKIVWIGRSSQLIHINLYTFCFLFGFMVFPLLIAALTYFSTKNTIYILTEQRLRVYSGIFSKRVDDVELYRVKDTVYTQPFLLRLFGLSSIQLVTSDISWGESTIQGIEKGMLLREKIRTFVEASKNRRGVQEIDYYTRGASLMTSK